MNRDSECNAEKCPPIPSAALFAIRRAEVDELVARATAAGGSTYDKPEDFGFMYTHSFVDPDGHGWGLFCMSEVPAGNI